MIAPHDHRIIFERGKPGAGVSVIVTVHNYQSVVTEALASLAAQTLAPLSLVIVEDRGQDRSVDVCHDWLAVHASRFEHACLVQHARNEGLSAARNTATALTHSKYIFVLDADNALYPRCIEQCLSHLDAGEAAFAYPIIERFGEETGLMGIEAWSRERLSTGNYIDAMSLIRRSALESVGGYIMSYGWEDFDLWCRMAEKNLHGVRVPNILARYRVHSTSMLRTVTNPRHAELNREMMLRHPWLKLR
jgi:glycosyltransferase involved in cell wall biosynthesis